MTLTLSRDSHSHLRGRDLTLTHPPPFRGVRVSERFPGVTTLYPLDEGDER
jgi:hypothetical protein